MEIDNRYFEINKSVALVNRAYKTIAEVHCYVEKNIEGIDSIATEYN